MKNKFDDPSQLRKSLDEKAAIRLAEKKKIEKEAAILRGVMIEAKKVGSLKTIKTDDGIVLSKAESQEKIDINEANQIAEICDEFFSKGKRREAALVREGLDFLHIIHSLVVLWRRCKALEKLVAQLDKST